MLRLIHTITAVHPHSWTRGIHNRTMSALLICFKFQGRFIKRFQAWLKRYQLAFMLRHSECVFFEVLLTPLPRDGTTYAYTENCSMKWSRLLRGVDPIPREFPSLCMFFMFCVSLRVTSSNQHQMP